MSPNFARHASRVLALFAACYLLHVGTASAALTEMQKTQILAVFNQARATTVIPAADMKRLVWDEEVADEMQAYTDGCVNIWEEFYDPPAFFMYRDHMKDPVDVAKWRTLRMAPYYDFETGLCMNTTKSLKICRHPENYEKVLYAENERVGCGMTRCGPGPKGVFHACAARIVPLEFQPRYAWTPGPRCSQCPSGFEYCVGGLCSAEPETMNPTRSPTTSRPTKNPTAFPTKAPVNATARPRHKRRRKHRGLADWV